MTKVPAYLHFKRIITKKISNNFFSFIGVLYSYFPYQFSSVVFINVQRNTSKTVSQLISFSFLHLCIKELEQRTGMNEISSTFKDLYWKIFTPKMNTHIISSG